MCRVAWHFGAVASDDFALIALSPQIANGPPAFKARLLKTEKNLALKLAFIYHRNRKISALKRPCPARPALTALHFRSSRAERILINVDDFAVCYKRERKIVDLI
jgi:hypothetical protein